MQPFAISPLLIVLCGAIAALVVGIFLPRRRQTLVAGWALAVLLAAVAAAAFKLAAPPGRVFDGTYVFDRPAIWTFVVLCLATAAVVLLAIPALRGDAREAEFYALLLFSLLGAALLAGAGDLMEILLGLLLSAVPSYALVAYRRTSPPALEALLKYYLFGALTNIGLIFGLVLLYGLTGTTLLEELGGAALASAATDSRLLLAVAAGLVVVGLGFKAGFVPAHFWIPDVFEGTSLAVAAYLSVVPKLGALLALARLSDALLPQVAGWPALLALVAAVTMTWGNIAAFRQEDLRRLLAYSTVAQAGYLLMAVVALDGSGLALDALTYYFAAYGLANLGAFAVLAATGRCGRLDNRGLLRQAPWLAFALLVALLSLVGLPPLAGFLGKFQLFAAAWQAGFAWLTLVALLNSALSLFYYLRALAPLFLDRPQAPGAALAGPARAVAYGCAAGSLALGLAGWLWPSQLSLSW